MPFCPATLDERTLKTFVDRLLAHQRQGEPGAKRHEAQATVAALLREHGVEQGG